MSQVLLIEENETLRKILKLNLVKSIGCDVIEKESAKEALSLLEILPDIDLVISREKIGKEETGLRISNFLEKEMSLIPLVIIGEKKSDYVHAVTIEANKSWENIIAVAGEILGVAPNPEESRVATEYVPVGIYYFLNITSICVGCDVFIRVKKNEKEFQYIKRLHSGDCFSRDDILKYKEGGLKEFYICKKHFVEFVNFATSELITKLGRAKLAGSERLLVSSDAYEVTIDRMHSVGVDDLTIELVQESIYSMESSLYENNNLATFLNTLKSNPLSYAYAHSYLCCLILHKVVGHFDWESSQVKEKLAYISYFHDISLKDISLMKINSTSELDSGNRSEREKELVNNHALESAAILEKFPKIPSGVATIIKEHHGSKSGIGFPETLSISLTPISMMFIVVEDFVDRFLKITGAPTRDDFEKIFESLEKRYNKLTYLQTLVALRNMTLNKKRPANERHSHEEAKK